MNPNNRADLNPRLTNQQTNRPRQQNTRFFYVNQPAQNAISNVPVTQSPQASNQNSITNKLCKFFKNLLELESNQGRYKESVAVIQKYINKEINIDELGAQLKGSASKSSLPDSLMTSLNSNIDDLRREMFYGRVRIDGINPPPESILNLNNQTSIMNSMNTNIIINNNSNLINTNPGTINVRIPTAQLMNQRPVAYPPNIVNNTAARPVQPQAPQVIRQAAQPNTRQLRPANNNATSILATQPILNLRTIAPSSPIRQPFVQNAISTNQNRTVVVATTALANTKSAPSSTTDDIKIEHVTSSAPEMAPVKHSDASSNNVRLPTNILNHTNYRNKINELIKSETGALLNISDDALNYLSEAMENFSTTLLEQAAVFACHRQEMFKDNKAYKKIDDVRSQMKFIQDMEEQQRASEEEKQKAELFKQAKSRSKLDNPEQQKIKETVRKIQEHDKNRDEYSRANMTALKAIGNKRKMIESEDGSALGGSGGGGNNLGPGIKTARFVNSGNVNANFANPVPNSQIYINPSFVSGANVPRATAPVRFRNKRIILKDFQLVLDQDIKLKRFKTYKKIFTYGRY